MYTPLLLLLGLLSSTSFSKPTPHSFKNPSARSFLSARAYENPYVITNYTSTFSNAGTTYSFNINFNSSGYTTEPNFATSCNGTNIQGGFVACAPLADGSQVVANEVPIFEASNLIVQHKYELPNPPEEPVHWVIQGNISVGISPSSSFNMTHTPYSEQED
jgi:hypothetical protein